GCTRRRCSGWRSLRDRSRGGPWARSYDQFELRSEARLQQHLIAVIFEEVKLSNAEAARVELAIDRNAHARQRNAVRDRRHQKSAVRAERDEPAIEEVVDRGRQEETVLTIQPFLVRRITPRLA